MLSMHFVRENTALVRANIERKKDEETLALLDALLKADEKWRALKKETDNLRSGRNKVSSAINDAKKKGEDASALLEEAKAIPAKLKAIEDEMERVYEKNLKPLLSKIPNIMHPDVPYGADANANPTIKEWGDKPEKSFTVKNHVEIAERLGLADFEAATKTSGKGFYFLKGDLARLNQALLRYSMEKMQNKDYTYVEPPLMVQRRVLDAAMDSAAFEASIYTVASEDNLALIGTSEHAILGMLDGQTLNEKDLPLKLYGYSMCFRQEIGSHGINEKGLWRTHQFNKVEMFQFTAPENSWDAFDEMLAISEEILQGLGLPYRVIECCTGDLAIWKARSFDLEVWRPTTGEYGEVMSLSNCTDYQARDLNIRVDRKGKLEVVHTLNNTAMATSRIMVAILENYQQHDGSVEVPSVLVPYMGGKKKLEPMK